MEEQNSKLVSLDTSDISIEPAPANQSVDPTPAAPIPVAAQEPKKKITKLRFQDMSPERRKEDQNKRKAKSRLKEAARLEKERNQPDSTEEADKDDAKKILGQRGIKNQHVLNTVYTILVQSAEENNFVPNRFYFQNGVKAMLAHRQKAPLPTDVISDEPVAGELISRSELFAIFDASIGWREQSLTFDEFVQVRQNCKRDCFYLGKEVLDKDFAQCHRVWSDFFPKFNPSTLPPAYTQKQMIQWLDSQSVKKDFLLMASRNSFKSSWSHVWLLTLILCCPDIRVLLVSETRPLSKDFIGAIRSYFEVVKGQETRFQRLFSEYTIPMGDGSVLSLEVPLARLRLPQSIESTSMDSAVAGRRADVIVYDDPISSTSCGNEVQIAASVAKHDALKKLREVGGLSVVLGTPWNENDLYATLIRRNEEDEDHPLQYRIDPAWTVLPEYELNEEGKPRKLREITKEMVTLLFPERLSWKFLQSELRANESFFASQNLCIFPKSDDADLKCTFTEDDLRAHIKPWSAFNMSRTISTVVCVDTNNFSTSALADFCCITTARIMKHEGHDACVITDIKLDRWRISEAAVAIVEAIHAAQPNHILLERSGIWESLRAEMLKAAMLRGYSIPYIYWKSCTLGNVLHAKSKRIKALEPMLASTPPRLYFTQGAWNDPVIAQFVKFDGVTKSNATRKDDAPDCIALLVEAFFPRQAGDPEKTAKQREADEAAAKEARDAALLRQQYSRYFGSDSMPRPEPEEPEGKPDNGLFRGLGTNLLRRNN